MNGPFVPAVAPVPARCAARAPWTGAAPTLVTLLVAVYAVLVSVLVVPANVDVSWLLTVGGRVLAGERLYVDVMEGNPPFSTWLYLPLLLLEKATGVAAEWWVSAGVAALAIASLAFSAAILAHEDTGLKDRPWLLPAAVFSVLYLFPMDFGQREQIGVIALLPWLALLAARDGRDDFGAPHALEKLVAGLGAAMFLLVKPPYSGLALAAPVAFVALRRRSLRPLRTAENGIALGALGAYLAALLLFHQPFFTGLLPLLGQAYLPMRLPVLEMLALWPIATFAAMAAATVALSFPRPVAPVARILLLAACGYVPAFLFMGKGWTYHALPFLTLGGLAFLIQAARLGPWPGLPVVAKAGLALGLYFGVKLVVGEQSLILKEPRSDLDAAAAAIRSVGERPTVFSIGPRLQTGNPLTRMAGGRPVALHPSTWMIANAGDLARAESDPGRRRELEALRDRYLAEIAAELAWKRPDIVLDGGLDYPDGATPMRSLPAFAEALAGYRLLHQDTTTTVLVRASIGSMP